MTRPCPACGAGGGELVYRAGDVPVHSCLLVDDAATARSFPRGELRLVLCEACGYLANRSFREQDTAYSTRYEDSQGFSATFAGYAAQLARQWVTGHRLAGRTVVEIGCGRGDFARCLVDAGAGRVVGVDPTLDPARAGRHERIEWRVARFEDTTFPDAAAVVFRHVLEHVAEPVGFLRRLRGAVAPGTVVLAEVPDARRILAEVAFWDVYYEHCGYFVPDTVAELFRVAGFEVTGVESAYHGQYLLVAATATGHPGPVRPTDQTATRQAARQFAAAATEQVARWRTRLAECAHDGRAVVLWGSGSKATGFLIAMGPQAEVVTALVDVNPYKQGKFALGTGHPILGPADLPSFPPDVVLVANPVYTAEITTMLSEAGLSPQVVPLEHPARAGTGV